VTGHPLTETMTSLTVADRSRSYHDSVPARTVTVCQVLHTLRVGGAEVLAARLARRLRDRYRFLFVCLEELGSLGEELSAEGFPVHVLGRRPGLDWRLALRLAGLLRRERVDVIHAHQYTPFFYAAVARPLGRRVPVVFTEHGRHFPDFPRRKRMIANRLLLGRRDRVVAVGQTVRNALVRNEGIPAERVGLVYNGIDLGRFATGSYDRATVRRELGLGAEDLVILQVARLDYLKDHATAVRTVRRVVRQRPDTRLVLVGEGPEGPKIRELVGQAGLTDCVRFLGLRNDVPRLLAAADLFLLTSISEGIPLTLIEAMAAGLPIVSTRVGGVGEVVEDGTTGLLAAAGDEDVLAQHVLALAADPHRAREMGRLGQARAEAFFSERGMHDRYSELYRELLRGRSTGEPSRQLACVC
jgi:sugar transferase (PEP-CTERM/EpsH1 system associated)